MRNETVQAWLLGKLVHEGLDAPPTGADRNAMNEFIRCVTKDAGYKYQAGGEHKPSVWVQNYPQHATLIRGALVDALDISDSSLGSLTYRPRTLREYRAAHTPNQAKCADVASPQVQQPIGGPPGGWGWWLIGGCVGCCTCGLGTETRMGTETGDRNRGQKVRQKLAFI